MVLVILLISLTTIISVFLYLKFARMLQLGKAFKGPLNLPLFGHGLHLIGKSPHEYLLMLTDYIKIYGNTFKVWMGPELNILTIDLKDIEVVLGTTKFNDKATLYKTMIPWLNEGLLISRGKKWFKRRKIITPAFHFKILEQFIEVFDQGGIKLVEQLRTQIDKEAFDFYSFVSTCTLDIICGKYECNTLI
ncbi:cytochrome P450 4d1-like [Eupeodes corollae]|uniref:cytochrome P450 4d1-like n=1 Tax=Eupeodes corollae TaxID=290404 RepID=UPI00248FAD38|nr:cytochrome P450 4d1-like [Eupeodes corollae]